MRRALLVLLAACGSDSVEPPAPRFQADYAGAYREVRDCRASSDHNLNKVRILASPDAYGPYTARVAPFPVGAIVLKEEYDFADGDCTGAIVEYTVMERIGDGDDDWAWQKVSPAREVLTEDEPRCINCHATCGVPPDGYLGTCAVP